MYERVVTRALAARLIDVDDAEIHHVDPADQAQVLSRHVETAVRRVLDSTRDPERRLLLVEQLLDVLAESDEVVPTPGRVRICVRARRTTYSMSASGRSRSPGGSTTHCRPISSPP